MCILVGLQKVLTKIDMLASLDCIQRFSRRKLLHHAATILLRNWSANNHYFNPSFYPLSVSVYLLNSTWLWHYSFGHNPCFWELNLERLQQLFTIRASGKTYTMLGVDDSPMNLGVIPSAIAWLYRLVDERRQTTGARFSVRVSAVEVTGRHEAVKDLLANVTAGKSSLERCPWEWDSLWKWESHATGTGQKWSQLLVWERKQQGKDPYFNGN